MRTRHALITIGFLVGFPGLANAQAQFSATAAPNPATLQAGGAAVGVTVTTSPASTFREPITYSFTGFPAGITTGGPLTVSPPFDPVTFSFSAAGSMAVGTYTGSLNGTTSGGTVTVPMTVIVQRPDFTLTASPGSLVLVPGESGSVTVAVTGTGGFSGMVQVASSAPASVSVQPETFALASGASRAVTITASSTAGPGSVSIGFSGTAPGVEGSRAAAVGVTIQLPPPAVDGITPPALAAGTRENVLRVTGRNFQANAVITSGSPAVQVVRSRVLSPTAAEVVVLVRPDAPPGPYRLDLRNPDGAVAPGGAMVTVHPAGALAGPLAVTAVRIVAPRPWQIVPEDEPVHAQALLATSGMGTVVGTWVLDGVPFERFTRVVSGGYPVEVRSGRPIPVTYAGEHRLELVLENPRSVPAQRVSFLQAPESRSGLRVLLPGPSGAVDPESPVFRWSLVPGASGYRIEVAYRTRARPEGGEPDAWTSVQRRVTRTEWRPEPALSAALRDAEVRFRVQAVFPGEVFGEPTVWSSVTLDPSGTELDRDGGLDPPDDGTGSGPGPWGGPESMGTYVTHAPAGETPDDGTLDGGRHLDLSVGSTTTATATGADLPGPSALTRLQLSTRTDIRGQRMEQQLVGDMAGSHDLGDPWDGRTEGGSWVARFAMPNGEVRPDAMLGFSPPSFLDQSEFLGVFGAGGGVQGSLASVAGRVSYYRSARLGASAGPGAPEPDVGVAAYELFTPDGRFLFRATTLHVTERPEEGFSSGGDGTGLGFLASADLGPRLRLLGEVALGDYRPGEDAFDEAREGRAFRVTAQGAAGTIGYSLAVGRTDAGFVNPANAGFTAGGVSGRTRAAMTVNRTFFGRASASGSFTHVRGGVAEGLGDPRTTENGVNVSLSVPVSGRVSVNLGGNVVAQRGAGLEELELPGTHRGGRGVNLTVAQTVGRFSLTQAVSWQDHSDRNQPWADQRVVNVNLGASGSLHRLLDVSAGASESRIAGDAEQGSTRLRLISVQPSVTLGRSGIRLTPRAAFTRTSNALHETDFRTTQYQVGARWAAPWSTVPLTFEVASDWQRNWSGFDEARPGFDRQTLLTVGLSWQSDRLW